MKASRYAVVFSGQINREQGRETVISNLVLELRISDAKAQALLDSPGLLLKRFDNPADAQRLIDRLERAGVVGVMQHSQGEPLAATPSGSESSLFRLLGSRPGKAGNQSILARLRRR